MIKRILPFLLVLLVLLCLSPLTVSADFLPEENPVGETLTVEPDSNIIKENLDKPSVPRENEKGWKNPASIKESAKKKSRRQVSALF